MTDEIVMYIVVREELKLSPGKLAAQVGHGVQLAIRAAERKSDATRAWLRAWEAGSYGKIVLSGHADVHARECRALAFEEHCAVVDVVDEGRTELKPNTTTCYAFTPMPKSIASKHLGSLRLYR